MRRTHCEQMSSRLAPIADTDERCRHFWYVCQEATYAVQQVSAAFGSCLVIAVDRQAHREHRAFARLARHHYVAAHHTRELAGDGEAKASAAETLCGRCIGLAEFLEQLRLLLRSHADAGV